MQKNMNDNTILGITPSEFVDRLWNKKLKILLVTFLFSILGLFISLSMPNVYRAQAILASAEENSSGLSSLAGQFGGLASLAGVNIPKGKLDKVTFALEILNSRAFIAGFIEKRNIAVQLLASNKFENGELVIDEDLYNSKTNVWTDKLLQPNHSEPTQWDLYNAFMEIIKVKDDDVKGTVIVSIEHISPKIAKQWVDWLIEDLNLHMKQRDIIEAEKSVIFLQEQINKTLVADMQKMFYQLIEKQYQTIMLANVREQYMFNVLDAAVVPQEKVKPQRSLMILLFSMFGFFSTILYYAILIFIKK